MFTDTAYRVELMAEGTPNLPTSRNRNSPIWVQVKYNIQWWSSKSAQAFTRRVWFAWGLQGRHELCHPNGNCVVERTIIITS